LTFLVHLFYYTSRYNNSLDIITAVQVRQVSYFQGSCW